MTIVGSIVDSASLRPVSWANADPLTVPTALNFNLNGATQGEAYGINSLGQIVGSILDSAGINTPVYWANADPLTPPTALNLNLNGAIGGHAHGINSLGRIVGYIIDSNFDATPVSWANADPSTPPIALNINLNGATRGAAYGINNLGQIVGYIINSQGVVIPVSWANAGPLTVPTTLNFNLNGASYGEARGINSLGQIVGYIIYSNFDATPVSWANADPLTVPTALNINGAIRGVAGGINSLGQIVGTFFDSQGDITTPVSWANADPSTLPTVLNINGAISGAAYGINDLPTPTPIISDICFPAGTPVNTDQGVIAIDKINPLRHTINGKRILHITQTVSVDKYLICIEKGALGPNTPTSRTVMTKQHKILYQGALVPAERLLDFPTGVKKVKYDGQLLYNILLEQYGVVRINNLTCETLHPDNAIAKLYQHQIKCEPIRTKPNKFYTLFHSTF